MPALFKNSCSHLAYQGDHKHVSDANSLLKAQVTDLEVDVHALVDLHGKNISLYRPKSSSSRPKMPRKRRFVADRVPALLLIDQYYYNLL